MLCIGFRYCLACINPIYMIGYETDFFFLNCHFFEFRTRNSNENVNTKKST